MPRPTFFGRKQAGGMLGDIILPRYTATRRWSRRGRAISPRRVSCVGDIIDDGEMPRRESMPIRFYSSIH